MIILINARPAILLLTDDLFSSFRQFLLKQQFLQEQFIFLFLSYTYFFVVGVMQIVGVYVLKYFSLAMIFVPVGIRQYPVGIRIIK